MPKKCTHLSIRGDNYGETCNQCGEQLAGYGCGGFFGSNLTGYEKCIHVFSPMFIGGGRACIYCQLIELDEDTTTPEGINP